MTTSQQYTPLEAFLLFQTLRADLNREAGPPSFTRISEALKENEYVRTNSNYEPRRLEPESLKSLYLEQMKEEAREDRAGSITPTKDGEVIPRKRKLSTPPAEFINDAATQKHLLTKVMSRLYLRYKEYVTKIIEEDERKYQQLQEDIAEIERGDWDARIQVPDPGPRRESKGVSSIQTLLRDDSEDPVQDAIISRDRPGVQRSLAETSHSKDSTPYTDLNGHVQQSSTPDDPTHRARAPSVGDSHNAHSPTHDGYPTLSRQSHTRTDSHGPYLPPISSAALSPTIDVNRRLLPPPQMNAPSLQSPRLTNSNSPIILPPPPGMLRASGSPAGPLDALADIAGQQYRPTQSAQSPRQSQFYSPQSHPNQLPQPRNYMQRSYPYYDSQVPYAQHYPPYAQSPVPPYQSPNSSQFQSPSNTSQQFWSGSRQNGTSQYQSPLPSYSHYSGYHPSPSSYQPSPQASRPFTGQSLSASLQATPLPSGNGRRRAQGLSPIDTSVSSTKWKRTSVTPNPVPGSPSPPGNEDISPISDEAPPPLPDPTEKEDVVYPNRNKEKAVHEDLKLGIGSTPARDTTSFRQRGRAGRPRGSSARGRGARAASTTSPKPAGSNATRTRSQSLVSHGDEASSIKPEPATPVGVPDDSLSNFRGDVPRTSGRVRRDTLRSLEAPPIISRTGVKRKRTETIEETPDPPSPITTFRPNQVLASRNFPRTSAPIMNDISTHKLAAMFAKPLTEREAPGYKDLIYRPQDLKSIRSAITAGSRALSALDDAGSPSKGMNKGSATLWVDKGPDVVPPKGIVNSAQLEKEVCRIFVNAVMYNPDPKHGLGPAYRTRSKAVGRVIDDSDDEEGIVEEDDGGGVVRDTREMFQSVEKSLSNWRAAERTVDDGRVRPRGGADTREEESMDELAMPILEEIAAEEQVGGTAKKRRRA